MNDTIRSSARKLVSWSGVLSGFRWSAAKGIVRLLPTPGDLDARVEGQQRLGKIARIGSDTIVACAKDGVRAIHTAQGSTA
jgi:hypothetical protein